MADPGWLNRIPAVVQVAGVNQVPAGTLNFAACTSTNVGGVLTVTPAGAALTSPTIAGSPIVTAFTVLNQADPKVNDSDVVIATLITNDATPTTVHTIATTSGRTYHVGGIVVVQNSAASAYGFYRLDAWFNHAAGVLTQRGATPVTTIAETDASMNVTCTASGTNIVITVTGLAASGRRWSGRIFVHEAQY